QAEEVVVGLRDRLRRPVLVDRADLELLQVAAIGMGAARLARGLLGLDGLRLAHGVLGSPRMACLGPGTLVGSAEPVAFSGKSTESADQESRLAQPPRLPQAPRHRRARARARDPVQAVSDD